MFKTKYRIKSWIGMASGLERYCVQAKFWWWPFWFELPNGGCFESLNEAEEHACRHASKNIVKVFFFRWEICLIGAICGLSLSGCATGSQHDINYRKRVQSFSLNAGITFTPSSEVIPSIHIGIDPTWTYRNPDTSGTTPSAK